MKKSRLLRILSNYGVTIENDTWHRDASGVPGEQGGLKGLSADEVFDLADLLTEAEEIGLIAPRPSLRELRQMGKIHEDADCKGLFVQVIRQAAADLKSKDPIKQLDALFWLTGSDFPLFAEAVNLPDLSPYRNLLPNFAEVRKQLHYSKSGA